MHISLTSAIAETHHLKCNPNYIQFLPKKCAIGAANFILTDSTLIVEKPVFVKKKVEPR